MKTYLLLFVLFFLYFAKLRAQENTTYDKLTLKFAPLSLLDPNRSVIQFGIEYKPIHWLGIQADYGLKFTPLHVFNWNSEKKELRYSTFRAEARFYLYHSDNLDFYTATEAFYLPETYRLYNQTVIRDTVEVRYDYSDIKRQAIGGTLKAGLSLIPTNKLRIDSYVGFGIRQRTIKHHTHNETPLPDYIFREWTSPVELHEGVKTLPHLSLGVKIGYVIF